MATRDSIGRTIDYQVVLIYLLLMLWGWITIYSASYDFDSSSIFSLDISSGRQLMWIGISLLAGGVLMFIDTKTFYNLADLVYFLIIILLCVTIVIAPDTKGSRSWLYIGSFALQPAEFAKFATALALAKYVDKSGYTPGNIRRNFFSWAIILLPVMLIFLQKETGSALVFLSLFFVLYREGMPGTLLLVAVLAIVDFILAVKFGEEMLWNFTGRGLFYVLLLTQIIFIVLLFVENPREGTIWRKVALVHAGVLALGAVVNKFLWQFNLCYVQIALLLLSVLLVLFLHVKKGLRKVLLTVAMVLGSIAFLYGVSYIFEKVLQPHQRVRIEVLLGMIDDPSGAGYNVNQAKISIGSGGFFGKGYLQGTQTKLKYVPEQDTDFIFCTVGEEFGFLGCTILIGLYVYLLIRLIQMAERQRSRFVQVYGYCVVSVLFFHILVNIGMVLGIMPVIGIPLPCFSYGGSSLLGFTILLSIFLKLDAERFKYN